MASRVIPAEGRMMGTRATFTVLALSVVFPSFMLAEMAYGRWGIAAYGVAGLLLLAAWVQAWPAIAGRLTEKQALFVIIAGFVVLEIAFLVVYPIANTHVPGHGSDSDDALDQATRALLAGEYPYRERTYLGNPVSPFPGGLLLSAPFVLLGGSAYQIVPWLALGCALLVRLSGSRRAAMWLVATIAISPGIMHLIATGSDHLPNSTAVLTGCLLLVWSAQEGWPRWRRVAGSVLLGLAIAWRPNLALVLLPLHVTLRRLGAPAADLLLVVVVAAAVTLPFYAYDPGGFAPLHNLARVSDVPWGAVVTPVAVGVVALFMAWWCDGSLTRFLLAAFVVVMAPVALVTVARLVGRGTLDTTRFGILATPFGLAAVASVMRRRMAVEAPARGPLPGWSIARVPDPRPGR